MEQETLKWEQHREAEQLLLHYLDEFASLNQSVNRFRERLLVNTSTRLFDWVDHFSVGYSPDNERQLKASGFVVEKEGPGYSVYHHSGAFLPRVVTYDESHVRVNGVAVSVEAVADFLLVWGLSAAIEGAPYTAYRRCCVAMENGIALWVVERRGKRTFQPAPATTGFLERYMEAREKWRCRPRRWEDEQEALNQAIVRAREMVAMVGSEVAAYLVLEAERVYWQSRNHAGQVQKARQDRVGMGWANHDHHTFRSSRALFLSLVTLFETLGFVCRERFYAGEEAGWGAQVMEHPGVRGVLFLDVDLSRDEVQIDFAHQPLKPCDELGTVGLWCALHGDSILFAGMHHLEAQFLFDNLKADLEGLGVGMMQPFSDLPYLRQAFTEAEMWAVPKHRIQRLLDNHQISPEEARRFSKEGALGSHLENLQRRHGYKGFNPKNVSDIIRRTDPRTAQLGR